MAVNRWERSANRNAANANNAGIVNSDGNVSNTGAANGNRVVPGLIRHAEGARTHGPLPAG